MRDHILSEIRRLDALNKEPPGQKLFARETGIAEHQWRGRFWARWGDALVEAGFEPNRWTERLDTDDVLDGVIIVCRSLGRFPTGSELDLFRKSNKELPTLQAIRRHFGTRADLISALKKRSAKDDSYHDIATMLPEAQPAPRETTAISKLRDGFVYLIKSGDFYKIGRSDDIERRMKEIRIALPDKATLIHSVRTDDPSGIEVYWHNRFKDKRVNGEWFKLTSLDISAFMKRKFQ